MAFIDTLPLEIIWGSFMVGLIFAFGIWGFRARKFARANSRLNSSLESLAEGYYSCDLNGTLLTANHAMRTLFNCEQDPDPIAFIDNAKSKAFVDSSRAAQFKKILFEQGSVDNFISELKRPNTGETMWIRESARLMLDPKSQKPQFYQGTITDITDVMRRKAAEERLELMTNSVPGGLFQLQRDIEGNLDLVYISKGYLDVLKLKDVMLDADNCLGPVHEDDQESLTMSLAESAINLKELDVSYRIIVDENTVNWVHIVANPHAHENDSVIWHGHISDVTKSKEAEARIERFAFYDTLTNLPNRRLVADRLMRAATMSSRHRNHGAVMFIDMDNFKIINDVQGHEVGDKFLVATADRLLSCVRSSDTVARFGGDEFLIVLSDLPSNAKQAEIHAKFVAQKILDALQEGFIIDGVKHIGGCSIGIRMFDGTELDPDHLIKCADIAMYRAKANGRNDFSVFHQDRLKEFSERYSLQSDLRAAIEGDQLELLYQPLISKNGKMTGAEALIRWNHPDYGLVMPNDFIPGAEESGQIVAISNWVISNVLQRLEEWADDPVLKDLQISANMSALQFKDHSFVPWLTEEMAKRKIGPKKLKLELTERVLADDPQFVLEQITQLHDIGVMFSLDDFGTGFSCLSQLKQFDFDELKIDGSFVSDIEHSESSRALVEAIIAMSEALGMVTVAEKVENQEQCNFLVRTGCDRFQGYFFAKPLPFDQMREYMKRRNRIVEHVPQQAASA